MRRVAAIMQPTTHDQVVIRFYTLSGVVCYYHNSPLADYKSSLISSLSRPSPSLQSFSLLRDVTLPLWVRVNELTSLACLTNVSKAWVLLESGSVFTRPGASSLYPT